VLLEFLQALQFTAITALEARFIPSIQILLNEYITATVGATSKLPFHREYSLLKPQPVFYQWLKQV
jgi:hypothetical protein